MRNRRTTWIAGPLDKAKALRMKWGRRGSIFATVMVLFGLIASAFTVSAATAATGSGSNVTYSNSTSQSSDKVTSVVSSDVKGKTTLRYEKSGGYSTSSKCYKGATFKSVQKAHKGAKCIIITKNGQKFVNSAFDRSGKRHWFNDYVGSSDSKAGTISATFRYDSKAKTWRKMNCGNAVKIGAKPVKESVSSIAIVKSFSNVTVTVTATATASVKAIADAFCDSGSSKASGHAEAYGTGTATATGTASAKTQAEATAKARNNAYAQKSAATLKTEASANAKADASADALAKASASAECSVTPPPTTTPPTQTPTPTPTPTVTVTPPPVVITYIPVCELSTKKIIKIDESKYDDKLYTRDLKACDVVTPPVVKIPVCELATKNIVTINEADFDAKKYSKNLDDCKVVVPPVKYIPVCDTVTKKIVSVDESNYDKTRYTTDLNQCKETPPPAKITVCELSSKKIVTINESDFNSSRYSKNLDDCKTPPAPQPEKPVVHINQKNDVDQSSIDPGTGKLDESTAPVFFTYTIWGSNSATVKVEAKFGTIRDISSSTVKGEGKVTFTYVAPAEVPKGGSDTITVTLKDTSSGMVASDSTDIVINPTPVIAK